MRVEVLSRASMGRVPTLLISAATAGVWMSLWACASRPVDREWVIRSAQGLGRVTSITRCNDIVFIADNRLRIRRFDLTANTLLPDLPLAQNLFATAMASDCRSNRLYVVTTIPLGRGKSASVYAIDLKDGEIVREYELPPTFLPRPGARFLWPDTLMIAGLWLPTDVAPVSLLERSPADYYAGLSLGVRLSATSGKVEPWVKAYENSCIGGGQCPDVRADTIGEPDALRTVAALPTSTRIGVYANPDRPGRLVNVVSQKFVRDGRALDVRAHVEDRMRWMTTNSVIDRVVAFKDRIAVVHKTNQIPEGWKVGENTPWTSHLNLYGWDGRAFVEDLPIASGFNVGFDDDSL